MCYFAYVTRVTAGYGRTDSRKFRTQPQSTVKPFRADGTKRCATDIVQFCGFSLCNAIPKGTDTVAGSLLVVNLSGIVIIKAG